MNCFRFLFFVHFILFHFICYTRDNILENSTQNMETFNFGGILFFMFFFFFVDVLPFGVAPKVIVFSHVCRCWKGTSSRTREYVLTSWHDLWNMCLPLVLCVCIDRLNSSKWAYLLTILNYLFNSIVCVYWHKPCGKVCFVYTRPFICWYDKM